MSTDGYTVDEHGRRHFHLRADMGQLGLKLSKNIDLGPHLSDENGTIQAAPAGQIKGNPKFLERPGDRTIKLDLGDKQVSVTFPTVEACEKVLGQL